jgi:hypothetical protein
VEVGERIGMPPYATPLEIRIFFLKKKKEEKKENKTA